jgi:hypothetical protein
MGSYLKSGFGDSNNPVRVKQPGRVEAVRVLVIAVESWENRSCRTGGRHQDLTETAAGGSKAH